MSESLSLIEFVKALLADSDLRDWFAHDPQAALHEYGLSNLSAADVQDALTLVNTDQDSDFSRTYNTGDNHIGGGHGSAPAPHGHESAGEYIQRVFTTNNYVDDRDTIVDQSINQHIDTGGGKFVQNIDNHSVVASGDGAVAAGGDIDGSKIVTGDGNTVGNGNVDGNGNVVGHGNQAVTGDGNTTGFGTGDVSNTTVHGPVHVGDGAAFNAGSGTAAIDNSDNSVNHSNNDTSDHSLDNVGNHWTDSSVNHSNNDTSDHSDNSDHSQENVGNTHVDASDNSTHTIDDSFDHLTHLHV